MSEKSGRTPKYGYFCEKGMRMSQWENPGYRDFSITGWEDLLLAVSCVGIGLIAIGVCALIIVAVIKLI